MQNLDIKLMYLNFFECYRNTKNKSIINSFRINDSKAKNK